MTFIYNGGSVGVFGGDVDVYFKRTIYNKKVIIHFTVQYGNIFGRVHSLKSHIGRAEGESNMTF